MPCTEAYKEHIEYTFNAFCRVVIISPAVRCSNIKFCWHLPVRLALRELHCSYLQSVKIRL